MSDASMGSDNGDSGNDKAELLLGDLADLIHLMGVIEAQAGTDNLLAHMTVLVGTTTPEQLEHARSLLQLMTTGLLTEYRPLLPNDIHTHRLANRPGTTGQDAAQNDSN